MQRPEGVWERVFQAESPKVGLCLAGMGNCQGDQCNWAGRTLAAPSPENLILAAVGVERTDLLLGELPTSGCPIEAGRGGRVGGAHGEPLMCSARLPIPG